MAKIIIWDDGTVIRGQTPDELVAETEAHIRSSHPRLVGQLSREEILAMGVDEVEEGLGGQGALRDPELF